MKTPILLILLLSLFACQHSKTVAQVSTAQHKPVDPAAKKLNDEAVDLTAQATRKNRAYIYLNAISLLDKAIHMDSNYYMAYWNKLSYQIHISRYDDALTTAKRLNRLLPNSPDFYITVGLLYEKTGDKQASLDYFKNALPIYNKILDTMSVKNKIHDTYLMNKGIDLIILGREDEGNAILKLLYDKQDANSYRAQYGKYLGKSKQQIINSFFVLSQ